MIIKRLILALLTVLAIARIISSLGDSLSQPQIQSRLELYQTNLVLRITEFSVEEEQANLQNALDSLVGKQPLEAAEKQYKKARQQIAVSRENFQAQLDKLSSKVNTNNNIEPSNLEIIADSQTNEIISLQQQELTKQVAEINSFINELDIKIGILNAAQDDIDEAISVWNKTIERINNPQDKFARTAKILKNLWSESPQVTTQAESIINNNLAGWFQNRVLKQLYIVENRQSDLSNLQKKEQELAEKAILKLALISSIPFLGGITGFILLIILLVQWVWKKEESVLGTNSNTAWTTPWDWEIIWQVLIVGFFFIGQFLLPFILGLSGFNPVNYSLRFKALYVLATYILMSISGIAVLYFSIKSFLPLPENWFRFKWLSNWFVWGFGGYLIALPLVLIVSLINQQIWQGQGGSNPLLFLALQAQDKVALAIFFITASVAAPIFEEIMFRGFLLPSLTRYVPVWSSIVISGLIFAIAHLSLSEVLPLATLGIILGFVYTRSRNLLAPMLLHSLWNSGTLLSLFILGSDLG
ncbi:MAG: CPBP family glutamic-type intramembrane protease [Xenococcaceae cyanobacterium MO_188.B32]|nr:CPBP family glutamic-type intramembrane protease [Xenococcaceae cyanobacterium MO_188.B32]